MNEWTIKGIVKKLEGGVKKVLKAKEAYQDAQLNFVKTTAEATQVAQDMRETADRVDGYVKAVELELGQDK